MVKPGGFEPIACEKYHLKDMYRPLWMQSMLMGTAEVVQKLEESTDEAELAKAKGLNDLTKGMAEEAAQGVCLEVVWFMLSVRKPL